MCVNYLWLRLKTGYTKENLQLSLSGDWGYINYDHFAMAIEVFRIHIIQSYSPILGLFSTRMINIPCHSALLLEFKIKITSCNTIQKCTIIYILP